MLQETTYNTQNDFEDEITIDLKKIFYAIWNRKDLLIKAFCSVFIFFVLLTFVLPKKYTVDTDLYINNAQSTNLAELNPYMIENLGNGSGGVAALMSGSNSGLINEIELIKSPLVMDKVIRENNLKYGKIFGIIPTKKTGEYISTAAFLKSNLSIENKKGTNVLSIKYKSKKPDIAYGVVNSIITNYIELHKQLHSEKSKSDKKLLEQEYKQAKENLDSKVNAMSGLPSTAVSSTGALSAMSAFSQSAQKALATLKNQVIEGQKSQIAVTEESQKVAELSSKLEWARLVDEMSDSSKVLVLKEPLLPRNFENSSPKLLINILFGIVFGTLAAIVVLIFIETTDKKLAYSMLGDKVIYNTADAFSELKLTLLTNQDKKIGLIAFENIPDKLKQQLADFNNINFIEADLSINFVRGINNFDSIITFVKTGRTDSKKYKQIKLMLQDMKKSIIKEVLL